MTELYLAILIILGVAATPLAASLILLVFDVRQRKRNNRKTVDRLQSSNLDDSQSQMSDVSKYMRLRNTWGDDE